MQQVTELLKAIAELIGAVAALVAPIATIIVAIIAKGEPHKPSDKRRKR